VLPACAIAALAQNEFTSTRLSGSPSPPAHLLMPAIFLYTSPLRAVNFLSLERFRDARCHHRSNCELAPVWSSALDDDQLLQQMNMDERHALPGETVKPSCPSRGLLREKLKCQTLRSVVPNAATRSRSQNASRNTTRRKIWASRNDANPAAIPDAPTSAAQEVAAAEIASASRLPATSAARPIQFLSSLRAADQCCAANAFLQVALNLSDASCAN